MDAHDQERLEVSASSELRRPMLYPVELRARDSRDSITDAYTERKPSAAAPICQTDGDTGYVQALTRRGVPPSVALAALRRIHIAHASGSRRVDELADRITFDALARAAFGGAA